MYFTIIKWNQGHLWWLLCRPMLFPGPLLDELSNCAVGEGIKLHAGGHRVGIVHHIWFLSTSCNSWMKLPTLFLCHSCHIFFSCVIILSFLLYQNYNFDLLPSVCDSLSHCLWRVHEVLYLPRANTDLSDQSQITYN